MNYVSSIHRPLAILPRIDLGNNYARNCNSHCQTSKRLNIMENNHSEKRMELARKIAEIETQICDLEMQIKAAEREIIRLNLEDKELYFTQFKK